MDGFLIPPPVSSFLPFQLSSTFRLPSFLFFGKKIRIMEFQLDGHNKHQVRIIFLFVPVVIVPSD
jgi:hypothetical protein